MRKALIVLAVAFGIGSSATTADALTLAIGDAYYLGYIDPGTPASAAMDVEYINFLIDVSCSPPNVPCTTTVDLPGPNDQTFGRYPYSGTLADATLPALLVDETAPIATSFPMAAGYFYLVAKYGNVAQVWVLNGISIGETINFPSSTGTGGGLSHWRVFGVASVPDGGATLGLLGLAMLGLGLLRQRMV